MNIPFSPPDIIDDDIALVVDALKSGWITTGPKTKEFEKKISQYCNTNKSVALNSATACLEVILRILEIGPGDEVITTAYTYTASASVICHVGAKPVIIDVDKDDFFISAKNIKNAITDKTKAIIAVDFAGVPVDFEPIYEAIKDANFTPKGNLQNSIGRICVICDAAHSFGAKRKSKMAGKMADFTCFSFHAVKNLTTAEGGALTWRNDIGIDDEYIYKQCMLYSLHGQNKDALAKTKKGQWKYDIVIPGYKCNMTDVAAGLGLSQLNRYEQILEKRRELVKAYDKAFINIDCINALAHNTNEYNSSCHLYVTRINGIDENTRDEIIEQMALRDISTNVHYIPLPMHTAYKNLGYDIKDFENSYNQYKNEITLPLYSIMTKQEQDYVIENFIDILRKKGLC